VRRAARSSRGIDAAEQAAALRAAAHARRAGRRTHESWWLGLEDRVEEGKFAGAAAAPPAVPDLSRNPCDREAPERMTKEQVWRLFRREVVFSPPSGRSSIDILCAFNPRAAWAMPHNRFLSEATPVRKLPSRTMAGDRRTT
jgi:hypothetical protein